MADLGFLDPGAELLATMAAQGCVIEGLRLLGGDLVLKIECSGAAGRLKQHVTIGRVGKMIADTTRRFATEVIDLIKCRVMANPSEFSGGSR